MRLLITGAAVAAVLFAASPAAAVKPPRFAITPQAVPAATFAHVTGVGSLLTVRGRAPKGTRVTITAPCTLTLCRAAAIADRKGRWTAVLDLVVVTGTRSVRVTAASATTRSNALLRLAIPPPATPIPGGRRLVVIGDSLASGTAAQLPILLPGWNVTTHARVGRFLAEGLAVLGATPLPEPAPILAFSLFTNDDPRQLAALEAAVRQAAVRAGPHGCMVWATIRRPRLAGVSYAAANALLHRLADEPGLGTRLVVVPWGETVARAPNLLTRDRVHPTPVGYARRAALFAAAAQSCADEPSAQPIPATPVGGVTPPV